MNIGIAVGCRIIFIGNCSFTDCIEFSRQFCANSTSVTEDKWHGQTRAARQDYIMKLRHVDYLSSRRALPVSELFPRSATCELAVLQRTTGKICQNQSRLQH